MFNRYLLILWPSLLVRVFRNLRVAQTDVELGQRYSVVVRRSFDLHFGAVCLIYS